MNVLSLILLFGVGAIGNDLVPTRTPAAIYPKLKDCQLEGAKFDVRKGVNPKCAYTIHRKTMEPMRATSVDGKLYAFGHQNLLFIRRQTKEGPTTQVISGVKSKLEKITSVALDSSAGRVIVLDQGEVPRILVFPTQRDGHVVPRILVEGAFLAGASSAKMNMDGSRFIVVNPAQGSIYLLPTKVDSRSPREEEQVRLSFSVSGSSTQLVEPVDALLSGDKRELAVLDGSRLLIFTRSNPATPGQVLDLSTFNSKAAPKRLRYDVGQMAFVVVYADNTETVFVQDPVQSNPSESDPAVE